MCNKVANRICCDACGYPMSEALYPDDFDDELPCDASPEIIAKHLNYVDRLYRTIQFHPFDCKCLLCR
jgi:hypothetical protein